MQTIVNYENLKKRLVNYHGHVLTRDMKHSAPLLGFVNLRHAPVKVSTLGGAAYLVTHYRKTIYVLWVLPIFSWDVLAS